MLISAGFFPPQEEPSFAYCRHEKALLPIVNLHFIGARVILTHLHEIRRAGHPEASQLAAEDLLASASFFFMITAVIIEGKDLMW